MQVDTFRILFGSLLNLWIWVALICNLICLYCIKRGKLYKLENNPINLITGFNMICDSVQLMMHVIYLGPSILLGNWFFEGEQNSTAVFLIGSYILEFWFLQSLIQILLATTRLHVIYNPEKNYFTVRRILRAFLLLIFFSLLATAVFQLSFSCCRLIPDPRVYGYSSLNLTKDGANISNYSIGLPFDIICSSICSVSYVKLFRHIHNLRKTYDTHVTAKEIRISIQCSLMFLTYFMTWSSFCVFPLFDVETPEIFIITTFVLIGNCGINSFIYITLNRDIQREIRLIFAYVDNTVIPATIIPNVNEQDPTQVEPNPA